MSVRLASVWDGVPDADALKCRLAVARDTARPAKERLDALSYLNGAVKVMLTIEKRRRVADYLATQIRAIRPTITY